MRGDYNSLPDNNNVSPQSKISSNKDLISEASTQKGYMYDACKCQEIKAAYISIIETAYTTCSI